MLYRLNDKTGFCFLPVICFQLQLFVSCSNQDLGPIIMFTSHTNHRRQVICCVKMKMDERKHPEKEGQIKQTCISSKFPAFNFPQLSPSTRHNASEHPRNDFPCDREKKKKSKAYQRLSLPCLAALAIQNPQQGVHRSVENLRTWRCNFNPDTPDHCVQSAEDFGYINHEKFVVH